TPEMLNSMAENPIVFGLANPDPEIDYDLAIETRKDVIMATGRSDFPNQVNNVLGFPYIFRGALDVQASTINEEMKLAAVRAVAKAAIDSGVAGKPIENFEEYETQLLDRMGRDEKLIRMMQSRARANPKRVTLSNAEEYNVLKAAQILYEEGIAKPILLGEKKFIKEQMERYGIELDVPIVDPMDDDQEDNRKTYRDLLWKLRQRKGVNEYKAKKFVRQRDYFGPLMLRNGDTDALI